MQLLENNNKGQDAVIYPNIDDFRVFDCGLFSQRVFYSSYTTGIIMWREMNHEASHMRNDSYAMKITCDKNKIFCK